MEQYADQIAEVSELCGMEFTVDSHDEILDSILVDYVHKFVVNSFIFCYYVLPSVRIITLD